MSYPESKTITLRKPVTLKGDTVTINVLELREPTVDELDRASQANSSGYASNAALISFVAAVPLQVARSIGKRDYEEAVAYLTGFTLDGQTTGAA